MGKILKITGINTETTKIMTIGEDEKNTHVKRPTSVFYFDTILEFSRESH